MSHFHVILQEIFHNLSIFQFSVSQILFWAFRRSRRAFRYIFARFLPLPFPNPVPVPAPAPEKFAKDAAPIPNAEERQQDNYITSSYSP